MRCHLKIEFIGDITKVIWSRDSDQIPGWMKLVDDAALKKQPRPDAENSDDECQKTYESIE